MSEGKIKGIVLKIGGDTQGLAKALSDVNKEIKNTQSELRSVERLLKIDPSNTILLQQKQRLLAKAIGETKEKLSALEQAGTKANEALASGKISQSQYEELQREIIATENTLRGLEAQAGAVDNTMAALEAQASAMDDTMEALGEQVEESADSFERLNQTGENLMNVGAAIEDVGQKIMPVSRVVGSLGKEAVKTAADFDSAMSKVGAVSGATTEELGELRDKAREMGEKTKFSAAEAAEAMNYMAMAGWKTSDMLNGIEGVMNLAAASGEDLATTSDILTDAMTAFGLKADETTNGIANATHTADVMAAAMSNANTNVSLLGEGFKYCSPVAGALGFSIEDTAEAIGLMSNSSVKGSMSGTAMRKVMQALAGDIELSGQEIGNLTIKTKEADGSMKELGDILDECRYAFSKMSESEQTANAEAMVGTNAMSGFLALMNAAPEDIDKLRGSIENCDGASQNMASVMQDNLNGQITTLKSKLSELAIAFGEILMPAIRAAADFVGKFIDWLNGLSPMMKTVVAIVGVIVAALGPVLVAVGKMIFYVGQIMTIIPKLSTALTAVKTAISAVKTVVAVLNTTLLANPIVLIIAGIVALVAAFIYFWNTCEEFRQFWIDLWEGIKTTAEAIWNGIKDFFAGIWDGIKTTAEAIWNGIKDFFTGIWEGIKTTAEAIWNGIKDFFAGIWEGIKTIAETVWEGVKDFFEGIWEGIKTTAQSVWGGIKDCLASAWERIKTTAETVWGGVKDFFVSTWEGIKTTAETAWDSIKTGVTDIVQGMSTNVADRVTSLKSKITEIWGQIRQSATAAWNNLVAGVQAALGNLGPKVKEGFQETIEFIATLPEKAIEWGKDFITGLINGIKQKVNAVLEPVREVAGKIREFLHFSRPHKGPLRDYETWMPDFMKGLADGIRNNQGLVTEAVNGLAKNMSLNGELSLDGKSGGTQLNGMAEMLDVMKRYLPYLAESRDVVLDSGEVVGSLSPKMNMAFSQIDRRERGR